MVKNDETCDYKFSSQPRTKARLKRTYTRLTGKESPPINTWKFNLSAPMTKFYRSYNKQGLLSEQWKDGKLIKLGNTNVSGEYNFNDNVVGLNISVSPYTSGGMHSSHAISAVKFNNKLFCFNAWGSGHKPLDEDIYKYLAGKYKCDKIMIYRGPSLQAGDPYGVCVGYATNFILEMLLKIAENKMPRNPNRGTYDNFVHTALRTRGICFGQQCVKEETIKTQWSKLERNLRKKVNTPSIPITPSMKLTQLKELAKKYKIKGVSTLPKAKLANKLRNEFKPALVRTNLENINFRSATPPKPKPKSATPPKPKPKSATPPKPKPLIKKNQTNVKTMTIHKLRKYAGDRCIKGRSKYPRVANLRKFVMGYQQPARSPLNKSKLNTLTAQGLRNYASRHCIRGYSKHPKKSGLRRFLTNKMTEG